MKKLFNYFLILLLTIMMVSPVISVYAYDTEGADNGDKPTLLYQADFDEAILLNGKTSSKGLSFDDDFYIKPGNYKFAEDIIVTDEYGWYFVLSFEKGSSTLDLDGHTTDLAIYATAFEEENGVSLTIIGEGENGIATVTNGVSVTEGANVTINGGKYDSTIYSTYNASLTINNATVTASINNMDMSSDNGSPLNKKLPVEKYYEFENSAIYATDGAILTINSGTFTSPDYSAVFLSSWADDEDDEEEQGPQSVVINGGTFTGEYNGIEVDCVDSLTINGGNFVGKQSFGAGIEDCESLVVNGGTFTGDEAGLATYTTVKNISLSGGVYTAVTGVDRTIKSGILLLTNDPNAYKTIFDSVLVDGHHYAPSFTTYNFTNDGLTKFEVAYTDKDIISIVQDEEEPEEPTVKQKEYNLTSANKKATAIFTFNDGHNFELFFDDLLTMSPEEIQEKYGVSEEEYESSLKTIKENLAKYGELLGLNVITIEDTSTNVGYSDALKLKIKMTDKMKKYKKLRLICLDEKKNFVIKDTINLVKKDDYAEGDPKHLSVYALVGSNEEESSSEIVNPSTGDNIMFYISMFGLSLIGLLLLNKVKNNNN